MKKLTFILGLVMAFGFGQLHSQGVGDPAPDFTFSQLGGSTFSLSDHAGKVVVVFVFGYNCHFCVTSGSLVESQLVDPYESRGDFIAVGIDVWDGSQSGVESFRSSTGVDFPLLMQGSSFATDYSTAHDRVIVVGKDGNIAFKNNSQAAGSVLDDAEDAIEVALAAAISSLHDEQVDRLKLRTFPNPASNSLAVEVADIESSLMSLRILNMAGEQFIQESYSGLTAGVNELLLDVSGLASGVYMLQLQTPEGLVNTSFIKN